MPDSWVKIASPQPTARAGRTHAALSPIHPRVLARFSAPHVFLYFVELLRQVDVRLPYARQRLPGAVEVAFAGEPAGAFRQLQHQAEHDRRRHGGHADRDAPVDDLGRADDGRDDDADADRDLEEEHQPAAVGSGRELGDVHRGGLRGAADSKAQHEAAE
jgi:hypothetical protein